MVADSVVFGFPAQFPIFISDFLSYFSVKKNVFKFYDSTKEKHLNVTVQTYDCNSIDTSLIATGDQTAQIVSFG